MKNRHWPPLGAAVGVAAGALFGFDYALAGLGLGLVAGGAIMLAMR